LQPIVENPFDQNLRASEIIVRNNIQVLLLQNVHIAEGEAFRKAPLIGPLKFFARNPEQGMSANIPYCHARIASSILSRRRLFCPCLPHVATSIWPVTAAVMRAARNSSSRVIDCSVFPFNRRSKSTACSTAFCNSDPGTGI